MGFKFLIPEKLHPCCEQLEKYAVHVGGGTNHRIGLYDGVMVKDNHLKVERDFAKVLQHFKEHGRTPEEVEIEVDSPEMLQEAIQAGARLVLA